MTVFADKLRDRVEEEELKLITNYPAEHTFIPPNVPQLRRLLRYGFILPPKWHTYQWQTLPDSAYSPRSLVMLEKDASGNKLPPRDLRIEHWTASALQYAVDRELYKPEPERSPEAALAGTPDRYSGSKRLWEQHIPCVREVKTFDDQGDCVLEYCVIISPATRRPPVEVEQRIRKWLQDEWKVFTEPHVYLSGFSSITYTPNVVRASRRRDQAHRSRPQ